MHLMHVAAQPHQPKAEASDGGEDPSQLKVVRTLSYVLCPGARVETNRDGQHDGDDCVDDCRDQNVFPVSHFSFVNYYI